MCRPSPIRCPVALLVALTHCASAYARLVPRDQSDNAGAEPGSSSVSPTPSTSVALIILYSITGVITALFLLIIVTGAIRAHRHPERYGPRAAARYGQPRQSRAKGIARAVLDTLPIVRFGPSENPEVPVKPSDVEMQNHNRDSTLVSEPRPSTEATSSGAVPPPDGAGEASEVSTASIPEEAKEAKEAKEAGEGNHTAEPAQLQCPVCMDDFEQGQEMRVLPCHHNFHPDCIDPWLLNVSGSCPLCRTDLHPESEQTGEENADSPDREQASLETQPTERHEHHHHHHRFTRYLNLARDTSGEERMAALRQLRHESRHQNGSGSGNDGENPTAENRRSVISLDRLKNVFIKRDRTSIVEPASESHVA